MSSSVVILFLFLFSAIAAASRSPPTPTHKADYGLLAMKNGDVLNRAIVPKWKKCTIHGGRPGDRSSKVYLNKCKGPRFEEPDRTCSFPALFNFGDSNSDTGALSAGLGIPIPIPNGETFFGKPAGRFCDGRLIIDFIASSLNLSYLSPYLDSLGSNFNSGANFAVARSTIWREFAAIYNPISLDVQCKQFSLFKSRSSSVYKQGENYFSDALYTFDIGMNDLTTAYRFNTSTEQVKATIPNIIVKFKKAIQIVYNKGGRNFWIHNVGPFGCLATIFEGNPAVKAEVDKYGCGVLGNEVAKLYNAKLKDVVNGLRAELPLASIVYVDVYTVKYSLFTEEAKKHGFFFFLKRMDLKIRWWRAAAVEAISILNIIADKRARSTVQNKLLEALAEIR